MSKDSLYTENGTLICKEPYILYRQSNKIILYFHQEAWKKGLIMWIGGKGNPIYYEGRAYDIQCMCKDILYINRVSLEWLLDKYVPGYTAIPIQPTGIIEALPEGNTFIILVLSERHE